MALSLAVPMSSQGKPLIAMEQEAYVDDIPFNTAAIALNYEIPPIFEEYVDDIPFNTAAIAMANKPCCFPMSKETNVDDIPFNTAAIAMVYKESPIPMEIEEEVDDIPFNTTEIGARLNIPMEPESNVEDPVLMEQQSCVTTQCNQTDQVLEDISYEIRAILDAALGDKNVQILDDPDVFFHEVGRMVLEELRFLKGYFSAMKNF